MPVVPAPLTRQTPRVAIHVLQGPAFWEERSSRVCVKRVPLTQPAPLSSPSDLKCRNSSNFTLVPQSPPLHWLLCRHVCLLEAPCPQPFKPRGTLLGCWACSPVWGNWAPRASRPRGGRCHHHCSAERLEPPSRAGLGFRLASLSSSCKRS